MISHTAGNDRACGQFWVSLGRSHVAALANVSGLKPLFAALLGRAPRQYRWEWQVCRSPCCWGVATSAAVVGLQSFAALLRSTPRRHGQQRQDCSRWGVLLGSRRAVGAKDHGQAFRGSGRRGLACTPWICGWICKHRGCFGRRCKGCWGILIGRLIAAASGGDTKAAREYSSAST